MRKKIFLFLAIIFLIGVVSAVEVSYCCERLANNGPWCQNAPQEQCADGFGKAPTSCESTSFCRMGVCINNQEGDCMPNTPQRVCDDAGGVWDEREKSGIPQCQLGCCLIGDQAAFVTQTRCKKLSSIYGLEINYRTDIQNERECISSAMPQTKGACVFEQEYERNCKVTTKKECQEMQTNETEFHEGFLCSAESLNTICGPRGGTTCVEGKDEVYFMDTCGNIANVYDASKLNDQNYWEKVTAPDCGDGEGNKDSASCGNCDYYSGSTCKKGIASYGNFICKDLKCEYKGEIYQHGETWCATDKEDEKTNSPGGRNFRLVCYNNEVMVEPCEEFRQQVCIQDSISTNQGGFKTAACRANQWQDCYSQDNERDCENTDKRDCEWTEGYSILKNQTDYTALTVSVSSSGVSISNPKREENSCVPKYAPGFDFWEDETDATSICSLANDVCIVEYYAGAAEGALTSLIGNKNGSIGWVAAGDPRCMADCKEKGGGMGSMGFVAGKYSLEATCAKECIKYSCVDEKGKLRNGWMEDREDVCTALGDCGVKNNYIGKEGYFDDWEEFFVREEAGKNASKSGGGGLLSGIGSIFGMG